MVRIVERHEFEFELVCNGCQSKLAANADDIKYVQWTDYGGFVDSQYYVQCPVCNTKVEIDKSSLPQFIVEKAVDEYRNRGSK